MNEDEPGRERPDAEPKAHGEHGEAPRAPAYLSGADATLRHTLRTPLNHIIGYSELLLEEAKERGLEDMVADLRNIHTAGKELLALINELFNPAAVETDSSAAVLDTVGLRLCIGTLAAWFVFVHVVAFPPRRVSIFSSNRGSSIGLIS